MKTIINKLGLLVLFGLFAFTTINAQTMDKTKKDKHKKHNCNEMCVKGHHNYVHGEKKHHCNETCNMPVSNSNLKEHICSPECHTNGACVMAHGEKGHTCNAQCKKTKP